MSCAHPDLICRECGFKPERPYSAEDRPEEHEDWRCDECVDALASAHPENRDTSTATPERP